MLFELKKKSMAIFSELWDLRVPPPPGPSCEGIMVDFIIPCKMGKVITPISKAKTTATHVYRFIMPFVRGIVIAASYNWDGSVS